jgi:ABC-type Fe3+-hydroxamate transport system substrate-binding protein
MIIQNVHAIKEPPKRIISLVPSQTEFLHAIGLEDEVIGITRFCVHPAHWRKEKGNIGGTKDVRLDRIHALKPDLIIANKEENVKEQVEALAKDFPVWVTDVVDVSSALSMMEEVGTLTNRIKNSAQIIEQVRQSLAELAQQPFNAVSAAYLIWKDPWMTVGGDTFIHDMMERAGLSNAFRSDTRYPVIELKELQERCPEIVLLSSEPYPFKAKHVEELKRLLPKSKVVLVDGEAFSWYGSRMLYGARYLSEQGRSWRS